MTEVVKAEIVDSVGIVAINRPHRHNAITGEVFDELSATINEYVRRREVRCILLRGEGRSFCSGHDTAQLGRRINGQDDFSFILDHQRLRLETLDSTKPVVAAVQGHALGGGFEIALSADIRIIADDAVFGLPEVGLGLVPDTGGTQILPALVGPARAKFLIMSGSRIDATTAFAWGLAEEVVPVDALYERSLTFCQTLATQPELAMAMAKLLINQATAGTIRNGIGQELLAQTALFSSAKHRRAKNEGQG